MHCTPTLQVKCVSTGNYYRSFDIFSGVWQGCPISQFLFNLLMDEVVHNALEEHENTGVDLVISERLCDSEYADDTAPFRYWIVHRLICTDLQELSLPSVCGLHLRIVEWCTTTGTLWSHLSLQTASVWMWSVDLPTLVVVWAMMEILVRKLILVSVKPECHAKIRFICGAKFKVSS